MICAALGALLGPACDWAPGEELVELVGIDAEWKFDSSATDLGTAWREPAFDDSGWASGAAALGFPLEENLPLVTIRTLLERGAPTVTFYFRAHFTMDRVSPGVALTSLNLIDDGAVFFINGNEVGRVAMPPGVIGYETLATRSDDIAGVRMDALEFSASDLVEGDNVLAVEVHQGALVSSDLVFASWLLAKVPDGSPILITAQPGDLQASLGAAARLSVVVDGSPPYRFQWYKDEFEVPGATNALLEFSPVSFADAGDYFVVASDTAGAVTSSVARVSVVIGSVPLIPLEHEWRYEATGTDQGTNWRAASFDDSAWPIGPAPLGFPEDEILPEPIRTPFPRLEGVFTYYFRTEFQLPVEPVDYELMLTTELDDGAVLYLNGEEITRIGMFPGEVNFGDASERNIADALLESFTLSTRGFKEGTNIMAVEVHQINGPSSDLVYAAELVLNPLPLTPIEVLREPEAVESEELQTALLSVEFEGTRVRLQWFKDGAPIPDATGASYAIPNVQLADAGVYHVVLSNQLSVVASAPATLTVLPDRIAPVPLVADGRESQATIQITFDEPVRLETVTNVTNYVLTNTLGGTLAVLSAVRLDATTVEILSEPRVLGANYLLMVENVEDLASMRNRVPPGTAVPVSMRIPLLGFDGEWAFYDPVPAVDDLDPGSNWSHVDYDSGGWDVGRGAFVFGAINLPEGVPRGTDLSGAPITTYFRSVVEVDPISPLGFGVVLRHVTGDGLVLYLNGAEFYRDNMPNTALTYLTRASSEMAPGLSGRIELPLAELGRENLLAGELHASAIDDPESVFGVELHVELDSFATGPVFITSGPGDRVVPEKGSVEFRFQGVGASFFQWYKDEVPIAGATNGSYQIQSASIGLDGSLFHVTASNANSAATSRKARLTVLPDMTPPGPQLDITLDGGEFVLTWSAEGFLVERAAFLEGPWIALPAELQSPLRQPVFHSRNFFFYRLRKIGEP